MTDTGPEPGQAPPSAGGRLRVHPATLRRRRILMILVGAVALTVAAGLISHALRDSIVFFFGPGELLARAPAAGERLRLGGMVAEGSLEIGPDGGMTFLVTDYQESVPVTYRGATPDLFAEGQGVVAEGVYREGIFRAESILAKHDENYMPREVAEMLKEAGVWREPPVAE